MSDAVAAERVLAERLEEANRGVFRLRRFTLGQWVADPLSPYRGDEAATRDMLERIGIPFIDTMMVPTPDRDPRKAR